MKLLAFILISLQVAFSTTVVKGQQLEPLNEAEIDKYKMAIVSGSFYLLPPMDYLRFLATDKPININDGRMASSRVIWMKEAPTNWVKNEDARQLINFINSKQECKPVHSAFSSYSCHENSTVGIEALHLLSLYRGQKYPSMCSNYFFCKPEKQPAMATEYAGWWKSYNR